MREVKYNFNRQIQDMPVYTLLTPELLAETIINQRQLWNNVEK